MKSIKSVLRIIVLFLAATALFSIKAYGREPAISKFHKLIVFYSPSCNHCIKAKNEVIPAIQKESGFKITVEYIDTSKIDGYKMMLILRQMYGLKPVNAVPIFYMEGHFLDDWKENKEVLNNFINESIKNPLNPKTSWASVDLLKYFNSFKPLAIVSAGLIDGINPCAFTVMVFFISFLALQGYRKRELIAVGLAFLFAVFLTYVLIGLGIMGFFYSIKSFWIISKLVNIGIGLFSIILGVFALYDLFVYMRTQNTDGLLLQLPKFVKNRIHNLVGTHYRGQAKAGIFKLVISALVIGFLISLLEAVCTGQVYLPTISFVLWTTPFKLQALGLLLLYNIMFVVPLFIVFLLAMLGATSEQFSHFLRKHLALIKILMAAVFFSFGIILVYSNLPQRIQSRNINTEHYRTAAPVIKSTAIKDKDTWDFGKVKHGEILKHAFSLKNTTGKTLNIINISTSCGCTASEVKKKVILPGEESLIEVSFNTKNYSGDVKQYVYVTTDNKEESFLRFIIKAKIEK